MLKLVTSDQFVAGIFAVLALGDRKHFRFSDTEIDGKFQEAFQDLVDAEATVDARPNFSFYVEPLFTQPIDFVEGSRLRAAFPC